ncbi:hypothetical protein [Microbacterium sp. NPDC057658]|uniref:hypothetical protein n=1 Tax=unclassified Microbacterium TaxID=2609290 RepID=UPI00366D3B14
MSDPVLIAIVGCVQAVTVALVGVIAVRIGKVRRDTTVAREQLENDHTTNLREENDGRHAETAGWFRELRRDIGGIREEIRGIRQDHRHLSARIDRIDTKGPTL